MTSAIANDQTPDEIHRPDSMLGPQFDSALFGSPPLRTGENLTDYMKLYQAIAAAVQPADIFERSSVRQMTDLLWELRRYRRIIAQMINASDQQGLEKLLRQLVPANPMDELLSGVDKSHDLARRYTLKEAAAVAEVDGLLTSAGLGWDAVKAEAAALRAVEIGRLNRLVVTAGARVNSTLRELERRRADLAKRLRRAVQQVQGADAGQISADQINADQVDADRACTDEGEPRQADNSAGLRIAA
jgi:hypothetical protein